MTLYEQKFRDILAEILQLDQAELDFGIYRIMNQKRKDIEAFLNNRLVPEVTKILKAQTAAGTDISAMENEVFSHLAKFFSRYYEGGDFISKRRYKDDAYAIPYSGEEVKLYWANADQYYIKTSEYFKNYSFVLPTSRRKVHFVLRDADTEQNNNKAANNMERRFQLCEEDCIAEEDGELNIFFTYELMPKTIKQDALIKDAEAKIISLFEKGKYADFAELVNEKVPTEKNKERTLLMKHLQDYTAKNNFDYFIHKDLGGFLRRELDFYIKNEVMFLDDLDATHIMEHLAQVKAIKLVGEKIITFLAQLEDFQKKLWLKKKFVVGCDYCITLDRIPRTLYSEIIANDVQRNEWVRLFAIDEIKGDMMTEGYSEPLTEKFLEDNPFLVLDTKFFSAEFKHKLVGSMEKVDEECNGFLINSENFQALELLQEKCSERVQNIYADPPYNTSASEIMYKNSYKHSSWLSLLEDRIRLGKKLLLDSGIQCTTIDDVEQSRLSLLLQDTFAELPETVTIRIKPSGRPIPNGFAISHEYALFSKKNLGTSIARLTHSEEQAARYREKDDKGRFLWELLRKAGSNSFRENRPTMYYPLFVNTNSLIVRLPKMRYEERTSEFVLEEQPLADEQIVFPIKDDGKEGRWYYGVERAVNEQHELKAVRNNRSSFDIYRRRRPNEGVQPTTSWIDSKYSATNPSWYELSIPEDRLNFHDFGKNVELWQDVTISLLRGYMDMAYKKAKSKEEQKHLKETRVTYYNIGMPDEYEIEVRNDLLNVVDHLKTLQAQVEVNKFGKDLVLDPPYFKALNVEEHLYKPLVFLAEKDVNGNRPYVDVVTGEPKLKVSPVALNLGEQNFVTSFREYCKAHQDDVLAGKQVYLLRNESKRGLGFFEANNFYPDFILWILDGEKQYITFIDPKGIRNLKGLEDDKIQLFKYLQTEVASQLGNAHLMLNSFIISNTPMEQVEFWLKNPFEKGEFQKNHVLFKDDKGYLETMVDMILQYM